MANVLRFLVVLFAGLVVALGLALASPSTPAYAQACDPSGTVDGTADPSTVTPGGVITFTAMRMSSNEEVSFWFTLPNGSVAGTAAPLCCASPDGTVRFAPLRIPDSFFQAPGRWALTVEGASSHHQSIIYFCVVTQQQPTAPPPTATTAPPPPSTATTAPPSPTTVEASPTTQATVPPTAEASPTTGVASPTTQATVPVSSPTAEASPTTVVATPTTALPPTVAPTVEATTTPSTIGMPVTGSSGGDTGLLYTGLVLVALSMLVLGFMARRAAPGRK